MAQPNLVSVFWFQLSRFFSLMTRSKKIRVILSVQLAQSLDNCAMVNKVLYDSEEQKLIYSVQVNT